jgi:RHS repeat-associated protein
MGRTVRAATLRLIPALALLGVAGAAMAQTPPQIPQVISPLTVEPDRNAVNLADGKITIDVPVLSVPGASHLRFDRIQNAAPYFSGSVSDQGPEGSYDRRSYSVHTGTGSSESFRCEDFDCTSITGSGSTFVPNGNRYTQAGTGVVYHFNEEHYHKAAPNQSMVYYVTSIDYQNGETITYTYDSATMTGEFIPGRVFRRPNTITSSLGYFISITYQGNDFNSNITAWSTPLQVSLFASSAPTVPLGRLTYNSDGTAITDHGSRTLNDPDGRTYHCTGCSNTLGVDLETTAGSTQLPTEASNLTQVTAATGGNVVGSVTRDGVGWTYSYDNLRQETWSNTWLYDHITVTGPNGFHNVYTAQPFVVSPPSQTRPGTHRNVITAVADSINRATSYSYDEFFRPVSITYPELNSVSVTYDEYGNIPVRTTRPKPGTGNPVTEAMHFPTDPTESCGNTSSNVHPISCYRPVWSRDGLQRQTDYAYNGVGQLTEQIDPPDQNGVRRRTSITYDASAGISRASKVRICNDTGASCGTSAPIQTEYDYVGTPSPLLPSAVRQIDVATGTTLATAFSYDTSGRLLSTDGPLAGGDDAVYSRYDLYGRKTWEIGPAGPDGVRMATRTSYRDSDDRPYLVEAGTIPSATSDVLNVQRQAGTIYDIRRNPIRETVSVGATTYSLVDRSFDDRGLVQCEAHRMNPEAFAVSPPVDACTLGTPGNGANDFGPDRITSMAYDAAGQRLQVRQGVGTTAEGTQATWAYNASGQITTVIDGNGNRAGLHYDGFGRQDCWIFPSSLPPSQRQVQFNDADPTTALASAGTVSGDCVTSGDYERYGYDLVGNRTSLRKRDGSLITYQYDNLNRLTAKLVPERTAGSQALTAAQTRDVYYGYDLRNAQTYARFDSAAGEGVTNVYDGFGQLSSTTLAMDGVSRALSYQYDAGGRRVQITQPDGAFFIYTYDARSRLTLVREGWSNWLNGFSFNALGLVSEQSYQGGVAGFAGYGYDALGRPSSVSHNLPNIGTNPDRDVSFSFGARNPAGQIPSVTRNNDAYAWGGHYAVTRTYTANGLNQYSQVGTAPYTYDLNGNLVAYVTPGGSQGFVYDIENRLVSASGAFNNASLRYDPLGRLYEVSGAAGTTRFFYDGDALVAEYNSAGTLTARYVHGSNAGADDPLIWYDSQGRRRSLITDQQGSVVALSDTSGGVAETSPPVVNTYDEYGIPGAGNQGRFQYTGQAWLPELGMYYYKARIYSPMLGRFMQTDPIGYADQFNLYAYVGGDPINRTDPTGTTILAHPGQEVQIAGMINRLTRARYSFSGPHGALRRISGGSASPGSRITTLGYYDRRIGDAIRSRNTATITQGDTVETSTGRMSMYDQSLGGGLTVAAERGGDQIVGVGTRAVIGAMGTNGRPLTQQPSEILMHELVVHAFPAMTGVDTGRGLENENIVRRELGLPERAPDSVPSHQPN